MDAQPSDPTLNQSATAVASSDSAEEGEEETDVAWADHTPEELPGGDYRYWVIMQNDNAPAEDDSGTQQIPLSRKDFLNFKRGLARRRGLYDDDGKYTDNGNMPLSRALAVLDNASRHHLREVAFAVQGLEWANKSAVKPAEEFLSHVLGAYWGGYLTPDNVREQLNQFEEDIKVARWVATEYLQQHPWIMDYKSEEPGTEADTTEEDEEFKPQATGDELELRQLKSFTSMLRSWKGFFEQFKVPQRWHKGSREMREGMTAARDTFASIEKGIDDVLKVPPRPVLKSDLPEKKTVPPQAAKASKPISPEEVPMRDGIAQLLGERRRELALKNPGGPPPTDREVLAAFFDGVVTDILAS